MFLISLSIRWYQIWSIILSRGSCVLIFWSFISETSCGWVWRIATSIINSIYSVISSLNSRFYGWFVSIVRALKPKLIILTGILRLHCWKLWSIAIILSFCKLFTLKYNWRLRIITSRCSSPYNPLVI